MNETHNRRWILKGHNGPINSLSFLEEGTYLASGASDGHVIVWSLKSGSLAHRLRPKQGPITVVRWLREPKCFKSFWLISAGANGTLVMWKFNIAMRTIEWIHMETVFDGAIEYLEVDETRALIAVTGMGRIAIYAANVLADSGPAKIKLVNMYPPLSEPRLPALPISAHFYEQGRCLMVGLLDARELVGYNILPWKQVWKQKFKTRIGSTAYHEATGKLLVWNLLDGVDIYSFTTEPSVSFSYLRKFDVNFRRTRISHVCLDAKGEVGICGSDSGEVYVWENSTGIPIQVLAHGTDHQIVQVLACYSYRHAKFYIASADSGPDDKNPCISIWSPDELEDKSDTKDENPGKTKKTNAHSRTITLCHSLSAALKLTGLVVVAVALILHYDYFVQISRTYQLR